MSPEVAENIKAADIVGKWIYYEWMSRRILKGFVQAERGGVIIEVSARSLSHGVVHLLQLSAIRIILVQTVAEEAAVKPLKPNGEIASISNNPSRCPAVDGGL